MADQLYTIQINETQRVRILEALNAYEQQVGFSEKEKNDPNIEYLAGCFADLPVEQVGQPKDMIHAFTL